MNAGEGGQTDFVVAAGPLKDKRLIDEGRMASNGFMQAVVLPGLVKGGGRAGVQAQMDSVVACMITCWGLPCACRPLWLLLTPV